MTTPTISRAQARELDRRSVDEYAMPSSLLMENAGRGVADKLCQLGVGGRVVICCGPGNNGGDGFVIARHLDLRGHEVSVLVFSDLARYEGDAALNLRILEKSGIAVHRGDLATLAEQLVGAVGVVDALLGTGARGEPRPPLDEVIDAVNGQGIPVLAVDLPSGLDCDSGHPAQHTVRAAHTCTFVALKPGFLAPEAKEYVGQVHVTQIGAPRRLVESILGAPGP